MRRNWNGGGMDYHLYGYHLYLIIIIIYSFIKYSADRTQHHNNVQNTPEIYSRKQVI